MKKLLIFTNFLISACGTHEPQVSPKAFTLEDKVSLYASNIKTHQDEHGFILSDKCDSTLFSGLLGAALPETVDLIQARDQEGAWHRRANQDCGEEFKNSKSTISRDMMLGVMWWMLKNNKLAEAEALMADLKENNYILKGQGSLGELGFIPSYTNTLALIIKALGGKSHKLELAFPAVIGRSGKGFERHLAVWHILLRGEAKGSITSYELETLKKMRDEQPMNPLFQAAYHKYTDGDFTIAENLLSNNMEWPSEKLPTTTEHCDEWPIQREYSEKDWGSCSPEEEHTGGELIVIYNLIIKGVPNGKVKDL
jgi:hypothetical protein